MKRRLIVAIVLASLGVWSVPVTLASPLPSGSSTAKKPSQQSSASMHDHSCCPGIPSQFVPPLFVTPAPVLPCGNQHPCCAKQGPENPPSLPAATASARPGSEVMGATIANQHHDGRVRLAAEVLGTNLFQSCSLRSTVLRI
jgi:hypothetical protein